jgi:ATP-binding protein involved in chromosome partitioning
MTTAQFNERQLRDVIAGFPDPETGRDVLKTGQISDIRISGGDISLTLNLTSHSAPIWEQTKMALTQRIGDGLPGLTSIEISVARHDRPPQPLGEIGLTAKSVIAIGSGKGGVGKSTLAAALACGLARSGSEVGLMDADVYGPSIPHLLGLEGRPDVIENRIQPMSTDSLRVMSMGFLVPPGEAVVWRGPMLHGAITQFLRDTAWGALDYLIIDMPPGTGDIALTLSQLLPLTGAIVVCTPQDVALIDAVKAIAMFRKVNIPMLGLVENMSGFECECGKRYDIFGKGGAKRRAQELEVPFLGEVPITISLREYGDAGKMMAVFDGTEAGPLFDKMCRDLVTSLAEASAANPPLPSLPVL